MSSQAGAVEIREATVTDTVSMAAVRARSWRATYAGLIPEETIARVEGTQERWATRMAELLAEASGRTAMFVAARDGEIVGFAISWPSPDDDATPETADIPAIYLDPAAIGQGIGRRLFAAAVEDVRHRGYAVATLWVLDTNERARRFYEAAGWWPDGATKEDQRPGGVLHEVRYRSPAL